MAFHHASRLRGRPPEWLQRATDIRFIEQNKADDETTKLFFEAPKFGDAAEEVYREGQLFGQQPDQGDTGFDLLGDMLHDIANRTRDSERFDPPLLGCFRKLEHPVFDRGIASITIQGHRLPTTRPPRIDHKLTELAVSLRKETPRSARVRVTGNLDMIRHSDQVFELIVGTGERIRGAWVGGDAAVLGQLWRQQVVIDGVAVFRPSGALLRVDTEGLQKAVKSDDFFSKVPTAAARSFDPKRMRRTQSSTTGANAVFGKWPGDESEEQLLAALKELG
ncbi:MAG: hypothetical protein HY287_14335 [Planctomycetes bacterium]|nr:hypothetical protein [Planctomycetota bacterium]MBI3835502.1 hypothetical protein [Planctomycetota bacterium]